MKGNGALKVIKQKEFNKGSKLSYILESILLYKISVISMHSSLIIEKRTAIEGQLKMRQSRIFSGNIPDPISDPTLDGDHCRVRNGQTNAQISRWLPLGLAPTESQSWLRLSRRRERKYDVHLTGTASSNWIRERPRFVKSDSARATRVLRDFNFRRISSR